MDEPKSFEAFAGSQSEEWSVPFDGGPWFASSDEGANMVAFFDNVPRDVKARLTFNGKVEAAAVWSGVLMHTLESRLSSWGYGVASGTLTVGMMQNRDEKAAVQVEKAAELVRAYAAFVGAAAHRSQHHRGSHSRRARHGAHGPDEGRSCDAPLHLQPWEGGDDYVWRWLRCSRTTPG